MKLTKNTRQRMLGFTLVELMVALAISSAIFVIMMSVMSTSGRFAANFHNSASAVESVTEAVSFLNAVMPQVVRVRQCGCRGATSTVAANCQWSDADESSVWYDPVYDGGASGPLVLFDADVETFYGGNNTGGTQQLLLDNLSATFGSQFGGCASYSAISPAADTLRGCKSQLTITYTPATAVSAGTPSNAGMIQIQMGSANPIRIGVNDRHGQRGVGVAEVSCGFVENTSSLQSGLLFAFNVKLKSRATMSQDPTDTLNYETWRRTDSGKNYERGSFKEVRMKFPFQNLSNRGVYQWRMLSNVSCLKVGESSGGVKERCCSLATDGTTCITCIPSGQSGSIDSCCSEKVSGGNCI